MSSHVLLFFSFSFFSGVVSRVFRLPVTEWTKDLLSGIFLLGVVSFFPGFSLFLCLEFLLSDKLSLLSLFAFSPVIDLLSLLCFFFFFSSVAPPLFLFADVEGGADVDEDVFGRSPGIPRGVPFPLPSLF